MRLPGTSLIPSLLILSFFGFAASPAHADPPTEKGFGPRLGFGVEPNQAVFGVQVLLGKPLGIFRFAPSFDIGTGDDVTTYVLNADVLVPVPLPGTRSSFYAGAGPTLAGWNARNGGDDLEVGLSLLAGVRFPFANNHLYTLESRFGLSDVPEFRLLVGVLFGSAPSPPSN